MSPQHWPRLDPVTGRWLCENCWNHIHWYSRDKDGFRIPATRKGAGSESACSGECHCIHLSEIEQVDAQRRRRRENLKASRREAQAELASADNPLRAFNPEFREKRSGKEGA